MITAHILSDQGRNIIYGGKGAKHPHSLNFCSFILWSI